MDKIIDRILTVLAVLAGLLLLFVTFSISYTIFARFLGYSGMISVVQFTEYSLLWMTLLGAAWALKRGKHVSVDLITGRLSPRVRRYFEIGHGIMGIAVCGLLFWYSALVTWSQYKRWVVDVQVVDVPKCMILVVIPVGFLFLSIQFLRMALEGIKEAMRTKGDPSRGIIGTGVQDPQTIAEGPEEERN